MIEKKGRGNSVDMLSKAKEQLRKERRSVLSNVFHMDKQFKRSPPKWSDEHKRQ